MGAQSWATARMHTLALPKSVLCIELGLQWPMAHYELAYLIKKKHGRPRRLDSILIRQQIPNIPWTYNDTIQMPISDHALLMLGIRWRIGAPDTPYRKPQPSVSKWYATHFQRFTNTMSTRPVKTTDPPPPCIRHDASCLLSQIADSGEKC